MGVLLTGEDPAFSTPEIKFLKKPGEGAKALMTGNVPHLKCVRACFSAIAMA